MAGSTTAVSARHADVVSRSPVYYGWVIWAVAMLAVIVSAPGHEFTMALFIDHYIADFYAVADTGSLFTAPLAGFGPFVETFNDGATTGRTVVSGLYTVGSLGAAFSLAWIGRQIDRFGTRRAGTVAGVIFAATLAFSALIQGPVMILISFALLRALGMGALFLLGTTAIAHWWILRRGWVFGLALVGFAIFQRVMLPALEATISTIGWRTTWMLMAVLVAAIFVPVWFALMRDKPEQHGLRPDNAAQSATGDDDPAANEENYTLKEARRLPIYWIFISGRIAAALMVAGFLFHMVSVFERVGYDAATAAGTYGTVALVNATMTLVAGRLVRYVRPGFFLAFQLTMITIALIFSQIMTESWMLLPFAAALGTGMAFGGTFDGTVWADLFGRQHHGAIRGSASTALVFGASMGPTLWAFGNDQFGTYAPIVAFGIAVIVVPLISSLFTTQPRPKAALSTA